MSSKELPIVYKLEHAEINYPKNLALQVHFDFENDHLLDISVKCVDFELSTNEALNLASNFCMQS